MTRLQTLQAKGMSPDLPDAGLAAHLVGYLFEVGPIAHGPSGPVPVSWPDLQAWQQATGIELQTWEARALRRLSYDYLDATLAAKSPTSPAPYAAQPSPDNRQAVANAVRNIFGKRKPH
jgi:hypothetical protein